MNADRFCKAVGQRPERIFERVGEGGSQVALRPPLDEIIQHRLRQAEVARYP
jgi:hypothetical protein